jgi:acyl-CoA synthetase (AMP-forming)/AMP-acid ligase II
MNARWRLMRSPTLTMASLLDELARLEPGCVTAYEPVNGVEVARTISALRDRVDVLATYLLNEAGLRPGDVVIIWRANDAEFLHWTLAAIRAGLVAAPLNPMLTAEEARQVVETADPRAVVVDATVPAATLADTRRLWLHSGEGSPAAGFLAVPEQLTGHSEPAVIGHKDTVAIFHTSGTTGRMKGAMLSSRALLAGRALAGAAGRVIGRHSVALVALPWAHIMGLSTAIYGLLAGVPACLMRRFDAETAATLIERRGITTFVGVPSMLTRLVALENAPQRLRSMRLWVSASDQLPPTTRERLLECGALMRLAGARVRPLIINAYGMVETGGAAMVALGGGLLGGACDLCFPVPPTRVRVATSDGQAVKRGEVGECQILSPGMTHGYHNQPTAGRALFAPDGWLRTGDLASRTRFGFVRLRGRDKDVVKCAGYSIYCAEVEQVLGAHPGVAAAAVVGVPDTGKGEIPLAFIEPAGEARLDAEELIRWCRARLAAYKVPRAWRIETGRPLPRGVTGKVLKAELRSWLELEGEARR